MSQRKCSKCGEPKAPDAFARNKKAPDGRRSVCKACEKTRRDGIISSGMCLSECGRESADGRVFCAACLAKNATRTARRNQSRAEQGLCRACGGNTPATCGLLCYAHWAKRTARDCLGSRELWHVVDEVWQRSGGRCALTGVPIAPGQAASLDHVVHKNRASNGGHEPSNLRFLHSAVNVMRHTMTDDELKQWCWRIILGPEAAANDNALPVEEDSDAAVRAVV